ncbi:hypothetical protein glysoja_044773 [Glycine soja]|uniref:Uncharacterized protein n=1 Tax=Glycine soja TaxID=3848 RepID=A0A0B2SQY1_GLYSO|nr:hypothetical protein JHK86_010358 [Glycine max]KHN47265.1 hypothetical protein glysoja_044773 [Glycine soja]
MLGNGKRINFLCDNWIQQNIASTLNILESYQQHLQALVANFISKNRWNLPSWDFPVWKPSDSRTLSFRQAFDFLYFANNAIPWAKMIWRPCIPSAKMLKPLIACFFIAPFPKQFGLGWNISFTLILTEVPYCICSLLPPEDFHTSYSLFCLLKMFHPLSNNKFDHNAMLPAVQEFSHLKVFGVDYHLRKPPNIKQVSWYPPIQCWINCNTDGATKGMSSIVGCGNIFRNHQVGIMGCFAMHIGN